MSKNGVIGVKRRHLSYLTITERTVKVVHVKVVIHQLAWNGNFSQMQKLRLKPRLEELLLTLNEFSIEYLDLLPAL